MKKPNPGGTRLNLLNARRRHERPVPQTAPPIVQSESIAVSAAGDPQVDLKTGYRARPLND
jgi:hypothetical protein